MSIPVADLPTILFVPGNRPERFEKAFSSGAPAIVLDLEDAVSLDGKDAARHNVHAWLSARPLGGVAAGLRINPPSSRLGLRDMARFFDGSVRPDFILMPKVEAAYETLLLHRLSESVPLICTIESALGLSRAFEIAQGAPSIASMAFGGADLASDLRATMEWEPLAPARATVVQASAAASRGALDVPYLDINDDDGLVREAKRAKAMGFTGKLAIHPRQVAHIIDVFLPGETEIEYARGMIAAADASRGDAVTLNGRMVDEATLRGARRTLALAAFRTGE